MKKLRLTVDEDEVQIPLLESIKRKCQIQHSNMPKTCLINGDEYQIQAIIATPTKNPQSALICQTSPLQYSQGREILKGGRYVEDHKRRNENSGPQKK